MTVKAILSRKGSTVVTLDRSGMLSDAVKILDEHQIGAVVITGAEQQLVGILSERDIVHTIARTPEFLQALAAFVTSPSSSS